MGHLYHGYVSHNQRVYLFISLSANFWKWLVSLFGAWCMMPRGKYSLSSLRRLQHVKLPGFPHAKPLNSVEVNVTNNWTSQFYFDLLYILEPLFT
jgi:hypothetical protein